MALQVCGAPCGAGGNWVGHSGGLLGCRCLRGAEQASKQRWATALIARAAYWLNRQWLGVIAMVVVASWLATVNALKRFWIWDVSTRNSRCNSSMSSRATSACAPCAVAGQTLLRRVMAIGNTAPAMTAKSGHLDGLGDMRGHSRGRLSRDGQQSTSKSKPRLSGFATGQVADGCLCAATAGGDLLLSQAGGAHGLDNGLPVHAPMVTGFRYFGNGFELPLFRSLRP